MAHIDEGIVIADASATIQYVNPAFSKITGYTIEEGRRPEQRLLKSGRHDASLYRDIWKDDSFWRSWRGLINRRKDGTDYSEEVIDRASAQPGRRDLPFYCRHARHVETQGLRDALFSAEKILEDVQSIAPMGSWELDWRLVSSADRPVFFHIFDWP